MIQIQTLIRERLVTILLVMIIGGFSGLLVELIFTGHLGGSQMIAVYTAAFGLSMGLHGLMAEGKTRTYLASVFLLLCIVGLVGIFEHYGARKTRETLALVQQMTEVAGTTPRWLPRVISPPLMAPLSISALSFLATLTLFAGGNEEQRQ